MLAQQAARVAEAWIMVRKLHGDDPSEYRRRAVSQSALAVLSTGTAFEVACGAASDMGGLNATWVDLERHMARYVHRPVSATPGAAGSGGLPPWCGECGDGIDNPSNAERFRVYPVIGERKCHRCHTGGASTQQLLERYGVTEEKLRQSA
jgi:hypothetical protein